jgi:hypothetical protein
LNIPNIALKDPLSKHWTYCPSGSVYTWTSIHLVSMKLMISGEPLTHQEDDKPEAVASGLRQNKDTAKPMLHQCSEIE